MCFVNYYDPCIYNVSFISVFNDVILINYLYLVSMRIYKDKFESSCFIAILAMYKYRVSAR